MNEFWVGIRGELTPDQQQTLMSSGLPYRGQLRESKAGYRGGDWIVLRTFVTVAADNVDAAKSRVAEALGAEADDLTALSAGFFT